MRNVQRPRRHVRPAVAACAAAAIVLPLAAYLPAAAAPSSPDTGAARTAATADAAEPFDALVFSKTAGFRHESIPTGIAAIEELGAANDFTVTATEDAGVFTSEGLADYEVVVFLSTTGDVLDAEQQAAFEEYIQAGGGYAGVHAASDTEYEWPWYGELVGAYFDSHPHNQDAAIDVEDGEHASTAHLPERWERFDEWYNYQSNPRENVHVLATLDETSYDAGDGAMGEDHPIAWCQAYDGGRSWYTGGGHTNESYAEPEFVQHLLGGIQYAAGATESGCGDDGGDPEPNPDATYQSVALDTETSNPMMLDVAADGTVFYAERDGRVQVISPDTGTTTTAMTLDVTLANEDGLTGIVLDPDFESNAWVYAFWSPNEVGEDGPHNRVSRFAYDPASKTIDPASETPILKIPTQRDTCCHAGGDMQFDADGNLVVVTGDNTNPFSSDGYAPIDEQEGQKNFDAQRTAANSNDLRGKVLRIHPEIDGSYTIPDGNMFPEAEDTEDRTRPEIYAMGFRNPFRIGLDPSTGNIHVADYGPDAGTSDPDRGPEGTVEWNVVSEPGFYGWPYCTGANNAYNDYDFATGTSGEKFDCDGGVVNDSPNNTGLTQLPPATPAEIWYGYSGNPDFPEIGGGGAPMGGPVYQYDPNVNSGVAWPEEWHDKAFLGEWNNGHVFGLELSGEQRDQITSIDRVLPEILDPSAGFYRPMDMDFGPDGALYVIDWGQGFGGDNDTSGIYRIEYSDGTGQNPVAKASADVTAGLAPLDVQFSSEGTNHPGGKDLELSWDFGDGETSSEANPTHTYAENGEYTAQLTATDPDGKIGRANVTVVVGNQRPVVEIVTPQDEASFEWGDEIPYEITVTDPDGGEVDCADVTLYTSLGHDTHAHPMDELSGCTGTFVTATDSGHDPSAHLYWVIEAVYTDDGGEVGIPLTGNDLQTLQPGAEPGDGDTHPGKGHGHGHGQGNGQGPGGGNGGGNSGGTSELS